jgi:hypothetical protein
MEHDTAVGICRRNQSARERVTRYMTRTFSVFTLALLATVFVACSGPGASPSPLPTPTPSPSPAPVTAVTSAAQAAALVFASDERFARMQPLRGDMIGQSAWYDASEDATGFSVVITVGAGDCQAGCIEHHTWSYHVDRDGTVALVGDQGDDITLEPPAPSGDAVTLNVSLLAGPVCPVERNPPDPACAPRPVVNVGLGVFNGAGQQVGEGVSDAGGMVSMQLPGGAYYVVATPVDGLMGTAMAQAFAAVGGDQVDLVLGYDTGIR